MTMNPKQTGRPKLPDSRKKRVSMSLKTTDSLRAALGDAAAASGRSLNQEIESRLERTLRDDDLFKCLVGDREMIEQVLALVEIKKALERITSLDPETGLMKRFEHNGERDHLMTVLMGQAAAALFAGKDRPAITDRLAAVVDRYTNNYEERERLDGFEFAGAILDWLRRRLLECESDDHKVQKRLTDDFYAGASKNLGAWITNFQRDLADQRRGIKDRITRSEG